MGSWSMVGAAVLIGIFVAGTARAESTGGVRCRTRLVSLGDTSYAP